MTFKRRFSALDARSKVEPVGMPAPTAVAVHKRDFVGGQFGPNDADEMSGHRGSPSSPSLPIVFGPAARDTPTTPAIRQRHEHRRNSGPSFAVAMAVVLLCGAGAGLYNAPAASADEITGLLVGYDVAGGRITLGNGEIFSLPPSFLSGSLEVGSVVRVTYENFGENDDEVRVSYIETLCNDLAISICLHTQNLQ
jgi:hypothetical protein